jgi:hypothetical protein
MDSGAFTTIAKHGGYPEPVEVYAAEIRKWAGRGNLVAAVAQDYMCEPVMLAQYGANDRGPSTAHNRAGRMGGAWPCC